MIPEAMPWTQFLLALWPLWVAYVVMIGMALANWWAHR